MKKIPWAKPFIFEQDKHYVQEALTSTWISSGAFIDRYEQKFCNHIRSPYGITVANGTLALYSALLVLNIGAGDEVIVPGYTFVAPANMVIATGATPVFADIDPQTWCVDPASVAALITPRTKAIIAVHIYGNMCDMDTLQTISRTHKLPLIEDAAEAVFSQWHNTYAGTGGDIGCFSFHAAKTVTMGEGGFITTRDPSLCARLRMLRDHGMKPEKRYWHEVIGYNFRLTNLQAALGCGQLENAKTICAERARIIEQYKKNLEAQQEIIFQKSLTPAHPVLWTVAVKVTTANFPNKRAEIMRELSADGIETRPGFYPFRVLPPYQCPRLPVSDQLSPRIICLPMHIGLSNDDIRYICSRLKKRISRT